MAWGKRAPVNRAKLMTKRSFLELVYGDAGQDIVEYALLTAAIGIVGVLAWQSINGGIGTAYGGWDSGTQALWVPPDPGAGS